MRTHFSEADTRVEFIEPALKKSKWGFKNICREFCISYSDRSTMKRGFVDYLLIYKDIPLAIIEAKRADKKSNSGLQKAIKYAESKDVRFVYASNGKNIYEFDRHTGKGQYVERFPSPHELMEKMRAPDVSLQEKLHHAPLHLQENESLRYYQDEGIRIAVASIAERKGGVLSIAPGAGITYMTFQILHKLFQCNWNIEGANRKPRVLILTELRVTVEQFISFFNSHWEEHKTVDLNNAVKHQVNFDGNIFLSTYRLFSSKRKKQVYYKIYQKDFFDIIVISDYGKNDKNTLGAILKYFSNAIHLGFSSTLQAKQDMFGKKLLYQYSFDAAVKDGFLEPLNMYSVALRLDYFEKLEEMDSKVVEETFLSLPERVPTNSSVKIAKEILKLKKPLGKTVVFCQDQNHALDMCNAINNEYLMHGTEYCARVTAADGAAGEKILERFRNGGPGAPVILTTVEKLLTRLDINDLSNIVLCKYVHSRMKLIQLISRVTRFAQGKKTPDIFDFTSLNFPLFE